MGPGLLAGHYEQKRKANKAVPIPRKCRTMSTDRACATVRNCCENVRVRHNIYST